MFKVKVESFKVPPTVALSYSETCLIEITYNLYYLVDVFVFKSRYDLLPSPFGNHSCDTRSKTILQSISHQNFYLPF